MPNANPILNNTHEVTIIGGGHMKYSQVNRFIRAIEQSEYFVHNKEVFLMSRRKAKKLAYRWRGSKRGRKMALWVAKNDINKNRLMEKDIHIEPPLTFKFQRNIKTQ